MSEERDKCTFQKELSVEMVDNGFMLPAIENALKSSAYVSRCIGGVGTTQCLGLQEQVRGSALVLNRLYGYLDPKEKPLLVSSCLDLCSELQKVKLCVGEFVSLGIIGHCLRNEYFSNRFELFIMQLRTTLDRVLQSFDADDFYLQRNVELLLSHIAAYYAQKSAQSAGRVQDHRQNKLFEEISSLIRKLHRCILREKSFARLKGKRVISECVSIKRRARALGLHTPRIDSLNLPSIKAEFVQSPRGIPVMFDSKADSLFGRFQGHPPCVADSPNMPLFHPEKKDAFANFASFDLNDKIGAVALDLAKVCGYGLFDTVCELESAGRYLGFSCESVRAACLGQTNTLRGSGKKFVLIRVRYQPSTVAPKRLFLSRVTSFFDDVATVLDVPSVHNVYNSTQKLAVQSLDDVAHGNLLFVDLSVQNLVPALTTAIAKGDVKTIIFALTMHMDSHEILLEAGKALIRIVTADELMGATFEHRKSVVTLGGISLLCRAPFRFPEHESPCAVALQVVAIVLKSDNVYCEDFMRENGIATALGSVGLYMNKKSPDALWRSVEIVEALSNYEGSFNAKSLLGEAGAIELLVQCSSLCPVKRSFAHAQKCICRTIRNLISGQTEAAFRNQEVLVASGGIRVVGEAVTRVPGDPEQYTCVAATMAQLSAQHQHMLVKDGGLGAVAHAMRRFSKLPHVQYYGMIVMSNISVFDAQSVIAVDGYRRVVLGMMHVHDADVAWRGALALNTLITSLDIWALEALLAVLSHVSAQGPGGKVAEYSFLAIKRMVSFVESGKVGALLSPSLRFCSCILSALHQSRFCAAAARRGMQLLNSLDTLDAQGTLYSELCANGLVDVIVSVLHSCKAVPEVILLCCDGILRLVQFTENATRCDAETSLAVSLDFGKSKTVTILGAAKILHAGDRRLESEVEESMRGIKTCQRRHRRAPHRLQFSQPNDMIEKRHKLIDSE